MLAIGDGSVVDLVVQSGSLGLLAYVVWWLLRRFNGKVDSLMNSVKENTGAIRELTRSIENRITHREDRTL